jgi:hypothetical protein
MADDSAVAPPDCLVTVLGACHSGADDLAAALAEALAQQAYTIDKAWLTEEGPQAHCWLLCGLDLPCPPALRERQQREDARLRSQLATAGRVFRVIYGATAQQRLSQALQAIDSVASCAVTASHRTAESRQRLRSRCEDCGDPDCERRLFTDLRG